MLVSFGIFSILTVSDEVFVCIIIGLLHYDHVPCMCNYSELPSQAPKSQYHSLCHKLQLGINFVLTHNTIVKILLGIPIYFHVTKEYLLVIEKSCQKHPKS